MTVYFKPQLNAILGEWRDNGFRFVDEPYHNKLHLYYGDDLVKTFNHKQFVGDLDNINLLHAICQNYWSRRMEALFD